MKTLSIILILMVAVCASSCAWGLSPVVGGLITTTKGPVGGVDNSVECSKQGFAECQGIICVAIGDASIRTAMKNGDITKVHHIDHETLCVLGIYSQYKVVVYGE
jgi:hypothetical protein